MNLLFILLTLGTEPTVSVSLPLSQAVAGGQVEIVVSASGKLTSPLVLKPGQTLRCEPGVEITCEYGTDGPCIELLDGCVIDGCTLIGKWTGAADAPIAYRQGQHGIAAYGAKNVKAMNCVVRTMHGDGFYAGPKTLTDRSPAEFTVTGCTFESNRRTGAAVSSGRGAFDGCKFLKTGGASTQAGLDLEPGDGGDTIDVTVKNCDSRENKHAAYLIALSRCRVNGAVPKITFTGCTGDSPPPWQLYRMADCWQSRKDAAGAWTGTNTGHPAEQLPVGSSIAIEGVQVLLKR